MIRCTTSIRMAACACGLTLVALTACSSGTTGGSASSSTAADAPLPDVNIPTQEEADARAAAEINTDNADSEFEALQREIENETEP